MIFLTKINDILKHNLALLEAEKSCINFTRASVIISKSDYDNIYTSPQSVKENLSILASCTSWEKSWPYHSHVDKTIL